MEMIPPAAASSAPSRRGGAVTEEERQRKRKTSNRLSAQRSRMKRQQREDNLAARAAQLETDNEAMRVTTGLVQQQCSLVEQQNRVLSADARYLYSLLQQRNSQLRQLGELAGVPMDVQEIPVHLTQLYGGLQTPPAPPLSFPPEIQMMFQPDQLDDIMDDAGSLPWL
ncbi:hypothetical protein CFC21_057829 [Triticum aestivum]|uniref:BZIP domain-containing protein n=3 Tax=Triticum TaxID=4564 RepID=A0A9R0WDQ0_TRITD|nr:ocs element-binding factor 1-like [Triticum dicoccoides]XP_044372694.1 ocs element-binding factor 1-like [Triticum aestivum]KAF7049261.1 hypothetical protein CFC21_057829 [Triticum aestivum]VAI06472.1 unnamed protein product [Triticum turgidum subsp. durum]